MAWNDELEENSPAFNLAASKSETIRAVAGPGTGKSYGIKKRILRLLEEEGVSPNKILAITFTRAAAHSLTQDIYSLGFGGARKVHIRTLHSHALRLLMRDQVLAQTGRMPRMVIDHEQQPILRDLNRGEFEDVRNKRRLLGAYLAAWARLQHDEPGFVQDRIEGLFQSDLTDWLSSHRGILVGEVVPIAIQYLRDNPGVDGIGDYEHILVDEFQDLNRSEQEFVRLIRGDANLVIVGDDDQSIYGFKHAHPEGIREIGLMFGEFEDIPFDVCRRCPQLVTRMASELISRNDNRTLGELGQFETNPEGQVDIVQWQDYDSEIEGITQFVANELEKGDINPEDILILTPRRRIGYRLRDALLSRQLPVKSYFRESVIESARVQRAYSLMHLLASPNDSVSLRFLLGFGSGDYRRRQYERISSIANDRSISVRQALDLIIKGDIPSTHLTSILEAYRGILQDLPRLRRSIEEDPEGGFASFFIETVQDEEDFSELEEVYFDSVSEIGTELLNDKENFENWFQQIMQNILERIALPDTPENIDHIRIMSLHSSKGLSANLVILTSMIDPLMPFTPRDSNQSQIAHIIQESRRLFYVAITRCKASSDYNGRLVISSFLMIPGVEALRLGIPAYANRTLRTRATRFITDFGLTAPRSIRGEDLA